MQSNAWGLVKQIGNALTLAPMELVNSKLISFDEAKQMSDLDELPEIFVSYPAYGNTSGPRRGIGGQIITSFPQVVLVYRYMCIAYIDYGAGVRKALKYTDAFLEAAGRGEALLDIKKEWRRDEVEEKN